MLRRADCWNVKDEDNSLADSLSCGWGVSNKARIYLIWTFVVLSAFPTLATRMGEAGRYPNTLWHDYYFAAG